MTFSLQDTIDDLENLNETTGSRRALMVAEALSNLDLSLERDAYLLRKYAKWLSNVAPDIGAEMEAEANNLISNWIMYHKGNPDVD